MKVLEQALKQRISKGLPGLKAQLKMSARKDVDELTTYFNGTNSRICAVTLLIYRQEHKLYIPFIQRPKYDGVHGGQIALPGGGIENTDADILDTALRETKEEIGVMLTRSHVIGELSKVYIPPSNSIVTPFIALHEGLPEFIPDHHEVENMVYAPIDELLNNSNQTYKSISLSEGHKIKVPCYDINGHIIWGATAMIVSEFLEVYSESIQLS